MVTQDEKAAFGILENAWQKMKEEMLSSKARSSTYKYNKAIFLNSLAYLEGWQPSMEDSDE